MVEAGDPAWREKRLSVGVAAEIKQKLDIVEVIGESVPLKKAGTTFKGLCPFHGEKTPSFVVTPARETWKCFGCGKGGDVFNFVMERESVDFREALRRLAARAGIEIDERTTREDARRKVLRDLVEAAVSFYHQVLVNSKAGERARDYLHERGFSDETIAAHALGYAPDAWDSLTRALTSKRGALEDDLVEAGLALRSERRGGVYDRFRGRIIFPIRDAAGNATGLGGRIVGAADSSRDQGPKYLNSPATPIFDKSRTLYLIDRAKAAMRRTGTAVLVEGNTDALMAHQQGFDNVVGTLGTALTAGQIELVTRYASRIALAYDVDAAGQSAATFGATELSALVGEFERSPHRGRLTDVAVVRLPDARDPDEVMRDDPDAWRAATENPQPIMDFLIDRYASRHDVHAAAGRERFVSAVAPTLRQIADPTRRDFYIQKVAQRALVEDRVVRERLRQPDARERGGEHGGAKINLDAVLASPGAVDPQAVARALEPVESTLLRLLLAAPEEQERVRDDLAPELIAATPGRELWRGMLADRDGDPDGAFRRDRFLESLDPTLAALARTLYARTDPLPEGDDLEHAVDDCIDQLRLRHNSERLEFLRAELVEAEASRDAPRAGSLKRQISELVNERLQMQRERTGLLHRTKPQPRTPAHAGGTA